MPIGLSVFGFIANEYKQRAIQSHLTICNIWSAFRWAITKVILNYSPLLKCKWLTIANPLAYNVKKLIRAIKSL